MGRLPIECERARLWASLAADMEITELERAALDAHLRGCGGCAAYAVQLGELVRVVRETPPVEPGRSLFLPRRRQGRGRLRLAASAAAVAAALALGSLAGTLSSGGTGSSPKQEAASHRLLIQQSLLALMAASPRHASAGGGRIIPS